MNACSSKKGAEPYRLDRRTFLKACSAALVLLPGCTLKPTRSAARSAQHLPARIGVAPEVAMPPGLRTPFGWPTVAITGDPLVLRWPELVAGTAPSHLRLGTGLDVRDEKKIEAYLPDSGRVLGVFDVRYASLLQIYQIALGPADAAAIQREGIGLRLVQGRPWRVFAPGEDVPVELQPHLLVPGTTSPAEEFTARLGSLSMVQPWSWNEGCVLDGLLDLGREDAARRHLALFLRHGRLVYEDPTSVPRDGELYGIEAGLPFAALARLEPTHPLLDEALRFWLAHRDADQAVIDGRNTTSEGAYVVGYPLAVIARQRGDEELQKLALAQISTRHARLFDSHAFWRTSHPGRPKGNRNWARGIAWQILGAARTLRELPRHPDAAAGIADFQQLARWVQPLQRPDGLWSVFVDEPQLRSDTAGSAGIATALAIGARQGWLDAGAYDAAAHCLAGLDPHLTPDGFLGGVSQSNRGGEELQRGDYRVLYQMGMGLRAQLIAALTA